MICLNKCTKPNQMRYRASAIQKLDLLNININKEKIRKSHFVSNETNDKISKMAEGVIKKDPENKRLSKMNSLNTDKLLALSINDKNSRIDRKEILKTQGKLFRTKNSANNLNIPLNDDSKRLKNIIKISSFNTKVNKSCEGKAALGSKNSSNNSKENNHSKCSNSQRLSKMTNSQLSGNTKKSSSGNSQKKDSSQKSSQDSDKILGGRKKSAHFRINVRRPSKSFNEIPVSVMKLINFIRKDNKDSDEGNIKKSMKVSFSENCRNEYARNSDSKEHQKDKTSDSVSCGLKSISSSQMKISQVYGINTKTQNFEALSRSSARSKRNHFNTELKHEKSVDNPNLNKMLDTSYPKIKMLQNSRFNCDSAQRRLRKESSLSSKDADSYGFSEKIDSPLLPIIPKRSINRIGEDLKSIEEKIEEERKEQSRLDRNSKNSPIKNHAVPSPLKISKVSKPKIPRAITSIQNHSNLSENSAKLRIDPKETITRIEKNDFNVEPKKQNTNINFKDLFKAIEHFEKSETQNLDTIQEKIDTSIKDKNNENDAISPTHYKIKQNQNYSRIINIRTKTEKIKFNKNINDKLSNPQNKSISSPLGRNIQMSGFWSNANKVMNHTQSNVEDILN